MNRIVENITDYSALGGVNISTLIHLGKSPLHYRHAVDRGFESTPAMRLGIAIHCAALEPVRFASEYTMTKRVAKGTGREETELTETQWETVVSTASAIHVDPLAMDLIRGSRRELALQWTDPESGTACKGRVDAVTQDHKLIDLKTCRDASPFGFCSQAARLEYHTKMAWYADAYELISGHKPEVYVIAVESAEPFDVVCYRLEDDPVLDLGRETYRDLLDKLVECRKSNTWHGVGGGNVQKFKLPNWAIPAEEGDALEGMEY